MLVDEKDFGLRELRKAAGFTSEQLGSIIGMASTYVTRIENGVIKNPAFSTIFRLAEAVSQSPKIKNNEINLKDYDSIFARFVMMFVNDDNSVTDYQHQLNGAKIKDALSNLQYLNREEIELFNSYSICKKHFVEMDKQISNFKESIQSKLSGIKYYTSNDIDFSKILETCTHQDDGEIRKYINSIIRDAIDGNKYAALLYTPLIIEKITESLTYEMCYDSLSDYIKQDNLYKEESINIVDQ